MSIKCHILHSISCACINLPILVLFLNCYVILIKGLPHHHPETTSGFIPSFLERERFCRPKHYENETSL